MNNKKRHIFLSLITLFVATLTSGCSKNVNINTLNDSNNTCSTSNSNVIISFNPNGGIISGRSSISISTTTKWLEIKNQAPTAIKDGLTFKGWSTSNINYIPIDDNMTFFASTSLYAFFNEISITFDSNGGRFIDGSTTKIIKNKKTIYLEDTSTPILDGCSFLYWFNLVDEVEHPITFPYTLNKNEERIYAKYSVSTLFIDLGKEGATFKSSNKHTKLLTSIPLNTTWGSIKGSIIEDIEVPTNIYIASFMVNDVDINDSYKIDKSITINAKYEIKVTFDVKSNAGHFADGETSDKITASFLGEGKTISDAKTSANIINNPIRDGYNFLGWFDSIKGGHKYLDTELILKDVKRAKGLVIYAQFAINTYTIRFNDANGNKIQEEVLEYGDLPTYKGIIPTKEPTPTNTFEFINWSPSITPVYKDITYNPTYVTKIRKYSIVFKNDDDTILDSQELPYGKIPEYTGPAPTKAATPEYTYEFNGWNPAIKEVTDNAIYTATYASTARIYNVSLSISAGSGKVDGAGQYAYGKNVTIKAIPSNGCSFDGWYKSASKVSSSTSYTFTMPASNVSYVAKFKYEPWYNLSDWWNYCSNGIAGQQATTSDIGREVSLTVNGKAHKVRLIDVDHDDLYSGSGKAHCTFEFSNLLSDSNGYSLATLWCASSSLNYDYLNSDLRKALDGQGTGTLRWYQKGAATKSNITTTVYDMLPTGLKSKIKTVKKSVATTYQYVVNNYDAKVFALSNTEIGGGSGSKIEGTTYKYYKDHSDDSYRIKYQTRWHDGAATTSTNISDVRGAYNYAGYNDSTKETYGSPYWLVSPATYGSGYVLQPTSYGYVSGSTGNKYAYAISPAFCI